GEEEQYIDGTALRVITDAEGQFEVVHMPLGKWKLAVRASGYAVKTTDLIPTDTRDVEITLTEGGSIAGSVVMAKTGEPVPDIGLNLSEERGRWNRHSVKTDADGTFEFAALADASYQIQIDDAERILVGPA